MSAPYLSLYAIALGFNALDADLDNVESLVLWPPGSQPLPDGSVKEQTLDGHTQVNGAQVTVWEWSAISYADFAALEPYFGEAVTIITRDGLTTFGKYNAYADKPQPGQDYQVRHGGIVDFRFKLDVTGAAT